MVFIGSTSRGTPVSLDPWLFEGGSVVAVNSVEPHYFAGFTGGRKSFLPGVASRETIVRNHYNACLPGSLPGRLKDNPVHEDMVEALAMLEERVEIIQGNGVMHRGRLVGFFAGSCGDSFAKASEASAALARVSVPGRSRLVVLHPGEPLHINLYQSEKAIYNCSSIVEEGGTLLLVTPCPEGLGASHLRQAFISSMDEGWKVPDSDSYVIGDHAIVRLQEMRKRLTIALASSLPDELVLEMGMEPVHDVRSWIMARDHDDAVFVPSAGFVVPCLENA
jgi:nickel-dependent lactate racemase